MLGERNWGEAGLTRPLLVPTLFHLHRYLLAGEAGKVVIAVQGVALALMTLTGHRDLVAAHDALGDR